MQGTCSECVFMRDVELYAGMRRIECWRYPPAGGGYAETKPGNTCGEFRALKAAPAPVQITAASKPPRSTRAIKTAPAKRGGRNG